MTCSLFDSTTLASATPSFRFMASRITTKASVPRLAIRDDVVRLVEIPLVDVFRGHKAIDLDRMRALQLDGLQLVLFDLEVAAFRQLVTSALWSLSTTRPVCSSTICCFRCPVLVLIWWK